MNSDLISLWRSIIVGDTKSWVLFEHGTCVILMKPEADLAAQAKALLAEWGPVHAGSPAGDFSVINLEDEKGWVVTCHHPDILTYVPPDEFGTPEPLQALIGITGRTCREQDADELNVIHVEDKRPPNTRKS